MDHETRNKIHGILSFQTAPTNLDSLQYNQSLIKQLAFADLIIPNDGPYLVSFDFFKNLDGETHSYVTLGGFNETWTYGGSLGSLKYIEIP